MLITSHIKQTNKNTNYYSINSFDRFNGRFDGDLIKQSLVRVTLTLLIYIFTKTNSYEMLSTANNTYINEY